MPTAACRPSLFEDRHGGDPAVTGPIRYRMPDGAEIVSEQGSTVTMQITMPADDAGHFGRQCPSCKRMFRMHVEDYKALPDDLRLTCPYCCLQEDHSEFMTEQQMERALAAAGEYAQQLVAGTLDEIFGNMARSVNARGGVIGMSYSGGSRTVSPGPLPAIVEEAPIRERTCAACGNRYAVFGEHVACPVCGPLPPKVVAQDVSMRRKPYWPSSTTSPPRCSGSCGRLGLWSGRLRAPWVGRLRPGDFLETDVPGPGDRWPRSDRRRR